MKLRNRRRAQKVLGALLICGALVYVFMGEKWIKQEVTMGEEWLKQEMAQTRHLKLEVAHPRPSLSQPEGKEADQLASKLKATNELVQHLQDEARARRDVAEPPTAQQRKSASELETMAADVETMAAELKATNELVKQLQHEARSTAQQRKSASEVETMAAELKAANELVKQLQHEAPRDVAEESPTAQNHSSSAESLRRCGKWGRFPPNGPELPSGTLRYRTANSKEILTSTIEHMQLPPAVPTSVNAYYLYLGDHAYECGVLMAAWRIRRFDKVNDIIVGVPASYKIDVARFVEQVPNLRVLQITEQTLPMVSNGLWKETSYKFVALGLVQYRRVIFLDADSMVLRDLGHLFDIPCEVHFMSPVYHAGDTPGFTTAFFAVTPSAGLYRESMQHVTTYCVTVCVSLCSHALSASLCFDFVTSNELIPWYLLPLIVAAVQLLDRHGVADMELMNDFWDHKLKGKVGVFNYVRIFPEVMLLPSHYLMLDNCFRMAGGGTNNGVEPWAKGRLEEFCVSAKVVHFTAFRSGGTKAFTQMDLLEKVARGSFPSSNLLHPCMGAHFRQYYIDSQQVCHDLTVNVPASQWTTTSREADKRLLESLPNQAIVSAAAKSTAKQAATNIEPQQPQLSGATVVSGKDCASITDIVQNGVYNKACCGMKRTNCDDCVCGRKECCG